MTLTDLYAKLRALRLEALVEVDDEVLGHHAAPAFRAALAHMELAQVELDRAAMAQAAHVAGSQ